MVHGAPGGSRVGLVVWVSGQVGAPQGAWTSYRSQPAHLAPSARRTKIYLPQNGPLHCPACPWPLPPFTRKSLVNLNKPRLQSERRLMLYTVLLYVQFTPSCYSLCCIARTFGLLDQGWA